MGATVALVYDRHRISKLKSQISKYYIILNKIFIYSKHARTLFKLSILFAQSLYIVCTIISVFV